MDEGDKQGEILHGLREELKREQKRVQSMIDNGEAFATGEISRDVYILGIDVDRELLDEDLGAFAAVRDGKWNRADFSNWVNRVDNQVKEEAIKLGLQVGSKDFLSPNYTPASPEYVRFANRHPRERFVKWLDWFGRDSALKHS